MSSSDTSQARKRPHRELARPPDDPGLGTERQERDPWPATLVRADDEHREVVVVGLAAPERREDVVAGLIEVAHLGTDGTAQGGDAVLDVRASCLDETVGVEDEGLVRMEVRGHLLVRLETAGTQRRTGRIQPLGRRAGTQSAHQDRRDVPRVGELEARVAGS